MECTYIHEHQFPECIPTLASFHVMMRLFMYIGNLIRLETECVLAVVKFPKFNSIIHFKMYYALLLGSQNLASSH